MATDSSQQTIAAVETAFAILEAIGRTEEPTLDELTTRVDVSKSTVYKHLATLESLGYVERRAGEYRTTDRFHSLPEGRECTADPISSASPLVSKLATNTGDVAGLYLLDGTRGTVVRQQVGDVLEDESFDVDVAPYLHATAPGKAVLSELPRERVIEIAEREGLPALGPNTITDVDTLLDELDRIRARGVAFEREEQSEDIRGIAAPCVWGDLDRIGAIFVVGPLHRMDSKRFEQDLPGILLSATERFPA